MPCLQAVAETPDRRLRNFQIDDARSAVERRGRRQLVPEMRYGCPYRQGMQEGHQL